MISKLLIDYIQFQNLSINKTIPIRIDLPSRHPANIKKAQPVGKNNTYSISFTCIIPNRNIFQVAINCHSGIPVRHQFTPVSGAVAKGLFWTSTCNGKERPWVTAGHHAIAARNACCIIPIGSMYAYMATFTINIPQSC